MGNLPRKGRNIMNSSTTKIDMLHGPLTKKLLLFTLPIALSSMLQQLFNAADTSIVGYFDNANSLAAVGTNGEIVALVVSLSSGLSIGTNVLIASRIGQKKTDQIPRIVHTAMTLAGILGVFGLLFGQGITRPLLTLIQTPDEILPSAELYLRIYFLGYPFLLLYDFASAILRARGDSRYPFFALTLAGIVNIFLNLVFVIILHLSVAGVSLATVLSTGLSALMLLNRLLKDPTEFHLSWKRLRIHRAELIQIMKIGIPSAVQGAVFCFANIFVQASVNSFGAIAIAGSTIAMNFEYFTYYIITAFGQTATTFVSQNYAAKQYKQCRKILWLCMGYSILFSMLMIEPIVVFRSGLSGLFSTEQAVIQNAGIRVMCILFFEPLCNLYEITAGVLRGSGHSLLPAVITVLGTCAFRILWICTVFRLHPQLEVLYAAFPISWVITTILMLGSLVILHPFDPRALPD